MLTFRTETLRLLHMKSLVLREETGPWSEVHALASTQRALVMNCMAAVLGADRAPLSCAPWHQQLACPETQLAHLSRRWGRDRELLLSRLPSQQHALPCLLIPKHPPSPKAQLPDKPSLTSPVPSVKSEGH